MTPKRPTPWQEWEGDRLALLAQLEAAHYGTEARRLIEQAWKESHPEPPR